LQNGAGICAVSGRDGRLWWAARVMKWEREKGRGWSVHIMNRLMLMISGGGVKSCKRFTLEQTMKTRRE